MSYQIYTSKGIVLSEWPVKEADRIYSILTRDFGLIHARALGVRKEASKLRGNLEPVSVASVSFVRGKEQWRATSATLIVRVPFSPYLARPLALLEKLVQGESANPGLFDAVEQALSLNVHDEDSDMGVIHEEIRERHNSHTIPALIRDLRDEGIILVRQELELAKTELAEKTSHVARNSAYMGVGAGVMFAGFLFLLAAATESLTIGLTDAGLAEWAAPLSALIVGIIVAAIGVAVAFKGKRAVAEVSPIPEKTLETLKEDKRWAEQKLKPDNHR